VLQEDDDMIKDFLGKTLSPFLAAWGDEGPDEDFFYYSSY